MTDVIRRLNNSNTLLW